MSNIAGLLARAAALRDETALNSISPERAGGIMYDTLLAMNELWLQQGAALVISKIYASVAAMNADTSPVSDLTGQPLRPGMIVVIASSDSDNGSVYRYNGTSSPRWSEVGTVGEVSPVDDLNSDSTTRPLAARQGKVLDGKIGQLLIKLVGIGTYYTSGVTAVGDIYFNTTNSVLRKCTTYYSPTNYAEVTIPFYEGAIYQYDNNLYIWNGSELVQFMNADEFGDKNNLITKTRDTVIGAINETARVIQSEIDVDYTSFDSYGLQNGSSTYKNWSTNSSQKHKYIEVHAGDTFSVTSNENYPARMAWVTSDQSSSGGLVPFVDDTSLATAIIEIPAGKNDVITAPQGAKYLCMYLGVYVSASTPFAYAPASIYKLLSANDFAEQINDDYVVPYRGDVSISMFKSIGVCGSSSSAGAIYQGSTFKGEFPELSWGKVLGRNCGIDVELYASSGTSSITWQTNQYCLPKLLADSPKDLYFIMIGINDGSTQKGTIADINLSDYTQNPNTYYGNMGRIISQIIEHAPHSKIILCKSFYPNVPGAIYDYSSTAIEEIAELYGIVYIETKESPLLVSSWISTSPEWQGGHPTAVGYAAMAKALRVLVEKVMYNNPTYFADFGV